MPTIRRGGIRNPPCSHRGLVAVGAIAVGLVLGPSAEAQFMEVSGTGYARRLEPVTYVGCPGTIDRLTEGDGGGVKRTFDVNLPFPFSFYGQTETTVSIFSGGTLAFPGGQNITVANTPLGDSNRPNGLIAVFWGDLELLSANNGFLGTSVTGSAPDRQFCIEWKNFNEEFENDSRVNFRVMLHEGPGGRIEVDYGPVTGPPGSYTATMGMEDQVGGRAFDFADPPCSPNCTQSNLLARTGRRITLITAQTDLIATAVEAPRFGFVGASGDVEVLVSSIDQQPIGPFELEVRVADNPQMRGAVLAGADTSSLRAFESRRSSVPILIPASFPAQSRVFFELTVDSGGFVAELDETNNTVVSASSTLLLPGAADLAVESVATTARTVGVGAQFDVEVRTRNLGSDPVANVELVAVVSTNPVVTGRDARLATTTVTLAPGGSIDSTLTVTVPAGIRSGTYTFGAVVDPDGRVSELEENNNQRALPRTITVSGADLTILTGSLPGGIERQAYTAFVTATGGSGNYRFTIAQGALPPGIGLVETTGELFGRGSAAGRAAFSVRVTDADDPSLVPATADLELTIRAGDATLEPLTVVTRQLPEAFAGQGYAFALQATGGQVDPATVRWSLVDDSALPAGFQLTEQGVLAGTTNEPGQFSLTVQADAETAVARRALLLTVRDSGRVQIVDEPLPRARIGTPFEHRLRALGGIGSISWRLVQGDLAALGLALDSSGRIFGTPNRVGPARFTVVASDSGQPRLLADETTVQLEVEDDGAVVITTSRLPEGRVEQGYDRAIAAVGGVPPYTWNVASGRLPAGLSASAFAATNELRIVGTPTEDAETNLLVEAIDLTGRATRRAFLLRVRPELAAPPAPDAGCSSAGASPRSSAGMGMLLAVTAAFALRRRTKVMPRQGVSR